MLRFVPTAWAKLVYLRDLGGTEVGFFAITSEEDLLLVEDIWLIRQSCTPLSVKFCDTAVADFFDEQVDAGRRPEQFARIWVHTHPADSAEPSCVDEETFVRCFGSADWAVMFIVAQTGQTYARLRFGVGPGGAMTLPFEIDYSQSFAASDHEAWDREYELNVEVEQNAFFTSPTCNDIVDRWWEDDEFLDAWGEYVQVEESIPEQRSTYAKDY